MKILVAEDQPVFARMLRQLLEEAGHDVTVADDGDAAWEVLSHHHVPLVISDWVMPGIEGPELCRHIRGRLGGPYTYIILLTALDSRGQRLEGLRSGADDFLTKPVDAEELAVRLEVAARILAVHDELAAKNAELEKLAATDGLTGLANRRRFDEQLTREVTQCGRSGAPLSLVVGDVDHFKAYNDSYGHPAGDEVLRSIGTELRAQLREQDLASRLGGEEFAVILPGASRLAAVRVAERIRKAVENRPWPHRGVTMSFGVATLDSRSAAGAATLLDWADDAVYRSKHEGRNRVHLATTKVQAES